MNRDLSQALNTRLRQPEASFSVPGSLPVLFFGDLLNARVATIGLNPSWQEYLDKERIELDGSARRFESLHSLGAQSRPTLTDAQCDRAVQTMRGYFAPSKPVYRWFAGLSRVASGFGAPFQEGGAVHLDLIQEATDPTWSGLAKADRRAFDALRQSDVRFLKWQIRAFGLDTLICTSRTVLDSVVELVNAHVLGVGEFEGRRCTVARADLGARSLTVVGWNMPLARPPGLSAEQQTRFGAFLRAWTDQHTTDAHW